jgi:uncharacterized protein (DUF736 family)
MIDIFVPANDDGIGDIQTLTIGRVSNDNRANENAPALWVFVRGPRIGDAWPARSSGTDPKNRQLVDAAELLF